MGRPLKTIKIEQCISILEENFKSFKDPRSGISEIQLKDFLLSSYAVFALKYPSLLSFEDDMINEKKTHNLQKLFNVDKIPSDTHLRYIMDEVEFKRFQKIFKKLFAEIQRSKLFPYPPELNPMEQVFQQLRKLKLSNAC